MTIPPLFSQGEYRHASGLREIMGAVAAIEIPDREGKTPEALMDEAWRRELLARAVEILEEAYRREGKDVYASVFRDYCLSDLDRLDYRDVASKYGLRTSDISNYLMNARGRLRLILKGLVAQTVDGEEAVREELATLFGDFKS